MILLARVRFLYVPRSSLYLTEDNLHGEQLDSSPQSVLLPKRLSEFAI